MAAGSFRFAIGLAAFLGASAVLAQSTASLPIQKTPTGGDVVVPIVVTPADGISTMEFVVAYQPSIVQPGGVFATSFAGAFGLVPKLEPPNRVRLSLSGPPLTGGGEVAWLTFHAVGGVSMSSGLLWNLCRLNAGLVVCTTQDGRVDVAGASATVFAPDNAQGAPGASVTVPVSATAFSGVESIDLTLVFDPGVIAATSVTKTTLTSGLTLTFNLGTPGTARISLFGTSPISGSGPIVNVTFQAVGALSERTPLDLRGVLFNEGSPSTIADDGMFLVCSAVDGDGDLQSSCAGDCNDANPLVFHGAAEACDGVDNDCNGWVDDVAAPSGRPALSLGKQDATTAALSWTAVALATGYDVVRGGIVLLRQAAGDFSSATDECVADSVSDTSTSDPGVPASGDGFWYLVRAVSCGGAGSYEESSSTQGGARDAGIASSPMACP